MDLQRARAQRDRVHLVQVDHADGGSGQWKDSARCGRGRHFARQQASRVERLIEDLRQVGQFVAAIIAGAAREMLGQQVRNRLRRPRSRPPRHRRRSGAASISAQTARHCAASISAATPRSATISMRWSASSRYTSTPLLASGVPDAQARKHILGAVARASCPRKHRGQRQRRFDREARPGRDAWLRPRQSPRAMRCSAAAREQLPARNRANRWRNARWTRCHHQLPEAPPPPLMPPPPDQPPPPPPKPPPPNRRQPRIRPIHRRARSRPPMAGPSPRKNPIAAPSPPTSSSDEINQATPPATPAPTTPRSSDGARRRRRAPPAQR